ncbi:MAG: hypothetical protein WC781_03545 [Candidatus Pacearchaeota archaeon]|jgi:hypothetical protein
METKYQPRIERETKLWVPHNDGEIEFAYPAVGPTIYKNVGKQILSNGCEVPIGDYTASLVHSAYCVPEIKDEPEFANVREIMKNNLLWVFNINLWTDKGLYVVEDLKAEGNDITFDVNQLEGMVERGEELSWGGIRFSKGKIVRFAPKGSYKFGEHTSESFAKDGMIVANFGIEGAEKLAEVASKFRNKPYIYGIEDAKEQKEQRVSALDGSWGYGRLRFVGGHLDDDWSDGYALGVEK